MNEEEGLREIRKEIKDTILKNAGRALLPAAVGLESYRFVEKKGKFVSALYDLEDLSSGKMPSRSGFGGIKRALTEDLGRIAGFCIGIGLEAFTYVSSIARALYEIAGENPDYAAAVSAVVVGALLRIPIYGILKVRIRQYQKRLEQVQETIDKKTREVEKRQRIREQWRT